MTCPLYDVVVGFYREKEGATTTITPFSLSRVHAKASSSCLFLLVRSTYSLKVTQLDAGMHAAGEVQRPYTSDASYMVSLQYSSSSSSQPPTNTRLRDPDARPVTGPP